MDKEKNQLQPPEGVNSTEWATILRVAFNLLKFNINIENKHAQVTDLYGELIAAIPEQQMYDAELLINKENSRIYERFSSLYEAYLAVLQEEGFQGNLPEDSFAAIVVTLLNQPA